jgi:hypothetical protein
MTLGVPLLRTGLYGMFARTFSLLHQAHDIAAVAPEHHRYTASRFSTHQKSAAENRLSAPNLAALRVSPS